MNHHGRGKTGRYWTQKSILFHKSKPEIGQQPRKRNEIKAIEKLSKNPNIRFRFRSLSLSILLDFTLNSLDFDFDFQTKSTSTAFELFAYDWNELAPTLVLVPVISEAIIVVVFLRAGNYQRRPPLMMMMNYLGVGFFWSFLKKWVWKSSMKWVWKFFEERKIREKKKMVMMMNLS